MNSNLKRFGALVVIPLALILGGCGWEPLVPTPEPEDVQQQDLPNLGPPGVVEVAINYDCQNCIVSQDEGTERAEAPVQYNFSADVGIPYPDEESVIHYSWDFGDGTFAQGADVFHVYENPGTYRVNIKIITSDGNEARDEYLVIAYPATAIADKVRTDSKEGMLCSFERTIPETIRENEPFKVQIVINTHQPVQVIQWEDVTWFPGFRLKQEPMGLWTMVEAGHRISLEYDVELWQEVQTEEVYMEGEVKCNKGGFGNSEVLEIRSALNIETSDEE